MSRRDTAPRDLQAEVEAEIRRRIAQGLLAVPEDPETARLAREYQVQPREQGRAA